MNLEEFAELVPGLSGMGHVEKIRLFAWYLLTHKGKDRFNHADIRACYDKLHFSLPGNLSTLIKQLGLKKPKDVLKDARGYRLERATKEKLDAKYGQRPLTLKVGAMLESLPGLVSDEAERLFLSEALTCFRNNAKRATIVMTWNLAYDHLLNWVLANHLPAFNSAIPKRYPNRRGYQVSKKDDFEEFKEFEVIEVCGTGGFLNDNLKKILNEKLTKRNIAAHPSLVEVTEYQVNDVISDLVHNVILKLK